MNTHKPAHVDAVGALTLHISSGLLKTMTQCCNGLLCVHSSEDRKQEIPKPTQSSMQHFLNQLPTWVSFINFHKRQAP